jgi:hypothetical protein
MELTDICRTFHPKTKEYTFFLVSTSWYFFYIIGHKTGLNKYKKIVIIPCNLLDHHVLRKVFNNKKKKKKKKQQKAYIHMETQQCPI